MYLIPYLNGIVIKFCSTGLTFFYNKFIETDQNIFNNDLFYYKMSYSED